MNSAAKVFDFIQKLRFIAKFHLRTPYFTEKPRRKILFIIFATAKILWTIILAAKISTLKKF